MAKSKKAEAEKAAEAPKQEPQAAPPTSAGKLVAKYEKMLEGAIADARISAAHTATVGWRNLYKTHRDSVRRVRESLAARLIAEADKFTKGEAGLATEKESGAIKTDAMQLRERCDQFEYETVRPVREPQIRASAVIAEAARAAEMEERVSGMFGKGLTSKMRNTLAAMPKVTWNETLGAVEVES